MNLHEYQGKQLFADYGLPVSKGYAVDTPRKRPKRPIDRRRYVGCKAQVHAGGRGKAGGVKLVKTQDEIREFARTWLGKNLVTYQTDENGQPVSKILVESCTILPRSCIWARCRSLFARIVFMASTEGGVEIEKVAEETPEKILRATFDPLVGAQPYQGRETGFPAGLCKASRLSSS